MNREGGHVLMVSLIFLLLISTILMNCFESVFMQGSLSNRYYYKLKVLNAAESFLDHLLKHSDQVDSEWFRSVRIEYQTKLISKDLSGNSIVMIMVKASERGAVVYLNKVYEIPSAFLDPASSAGRR